MRSSMTWTRQLLPATGALVFIGALASADVAHAGPVYSDDFTGSDGTTLNGREPDQIANGETWTANSSFELNGSGSVELPPSSSQGRSAHLPFSFDSNGKWTLTARTTNLHASDSTAWSAIGWANSNSTQSLGGTGTYWMLWRGNDDLKTFEGSGTGGAGSGVSSVTGENDTLDLRVTIDQPSDRALFEYKAPSVSSWNTARTIDGLDQTLLDNVTHVSLARAKTGTDVTDNVEFSSFEVVPEPSSLALVSLGTGLVLVRRRRRRC